MTRRKVLVAEISADAKRGMQPTAGGTDFKLTYFFAGGYSASLT